jgi:membrane associated rhomboid family serine protease
MGIYDREYYRDERSSFLGSLNRQGQVWKSLIFVNVVLFVLQLLTAERGGVDGSVTEALVVKTDAVLHGQVWRLLTGAFVHSADWKHILFNMLILWWAGSEVEGIYGPREFLAFYLTAAVFSSCAFVIWDVLSGSGHSAMYGASGAVNACLLLFALHFPTRTVLLFFVLPVPVLVLALVYVTFDAFGALGHRPGENIAFAAHLGGALFGFLYYKLHWRITNLLPSRRLLSIGRPHPRLRVYRGEAQSREPERVAAPAGPLPASETILEAELDAVLAKVARDGKGSLSEREQQVLMRASEIYRNRRK